MGDLLSIKLDPGPLLRALKNAPASVDAEVRKVVKATGDRVVGIIKFRTPADTGRARLAWKATPVGRGLSVKISNDTPYINVLEFGGYPVRASPPAKATPGSFRRGGAVLGGLPPRGKRLRGGGRATARTKRAGGGEPEMTNNVSKQAPTGMIRITLIEIEGQFLRDLDDAIDRGLAAT